MVGFRSIVVIVKTLPANYFQWSKCNENKDHNDLVFREVFFLAVFGQCKPKTSLVAFYTKVCLRLSKKSAGQF